MNTNTLNNNRMSKMSDATTGCVRNFGQYANIRPPM